MYNYEPLTDEQWKHFEPYFPKPVKRGRGKPHTPWRNVVNSILLVLLSKVKWSFIPKKAEFATKSASHRWFVIWDKSGLLSELVETYKKVSSKEVEIAVPPRRNRQRKNAKLDFPGFEMEENFMENYSELPVQSVDRPVSNL